MRSNGMLRSSSGAMLAQQSQSRLARLHKMASAAELRAAKYSEANQSKMEAADKAAAWRASMPQRRMAADAAREMQANEMEAMAAPVDIAHVDPLVNHKAVDRQKLRSTQFVKGASEALNSRFSDMFKAFQYVDLDRSGTLNKAELTRAIEMWNLPVDSDQLDDLIAACDADGDGNVDYKEFVDVLARDTVAPAAMGKRDMQAMQAMGTADVDPTFLGHGAKVKHAYAKPAPSQSSAAASAYQPADAAGYLQQAAPTAPARQAADRQKLRSTQFVKGASEALNSRFSDMFKAFQFVDLDRSGTLNKAELTRAIEMWNLPVDSDQLDDLIAACDADGDGNVDYKEFVDVLARDTVAPAAMGKRDMQAMQAMGAADVDPTFLGHGAKVKHAYATKK